KFLRAIPHNCQQHIGKHPRNRRERAQDTVQALFEVKTPEKEQLSPPPRSGKCIEKSRRQFFSPFARDVATQRYHDALWQRRQRYRRQTRLLRGGVDDAVRSQDIPALDRPEINRLAPSVDRQRIRIEHAMGHQHIWSTMTIACASCHKIDRIPERMQMDDISRPDALIELAATSPFPGGKA